jgi:membrane fusion protein (multidrug efflux system)
VNQEPAIQPANVQVVQPHRGEISRSVTLPANIRAYQQATLYAKVAGYLKSISVDRGDLVKAGDMLAEVEVPELLAEQARFKAEVDVAKVDYERVSQAMKKAVDLVMPQTVDEAKAKYEIAMANLKRNETLLDYAKIVAPFSGVITRRWVDPGALIPSATSSSAPQNAAVVTLMDFSKVRIDVAVPEQETPLVKNDLPVKITVEELPGKAFAGKVTRFAYALDDMTKTMDAEIEMPNPNQELRPGMFATAKIAVQRKHDALLMPIEALVSEKSKTSVFTLVQNKAKKVLVKIGFNDGAMAEIVEGLNGDEMVILPGKMSLNDGQPVNVADVARGK